MAIMNMVQALNLALKEEMERDKDVVILGEDVGKDGGVFRVTEGLYNRFGPSALSIRLLPRQASLVLLLAWPFTD